MPVDILEHHNRIIHDQTDSQNEGQQRERIDAETRHRHQRKGANQ